MGCDGGTIPKRSELVRNKKNDEDKKDKNAESAAKWQFCALSGLPLSEPIVSCQLGRLYNKEAICTYLVEKRLRKKEKDTTKIRANPLMRHITKLNHVRTLKLSKKPQSSKAQQASSASDAFRATYVCPISGLEMNGRYGFCYSWACGCVVSEKAFKEVVGTSECLVCSKRYDREVDIVNLNCDEYNFETLQVIIARRREKEEISRQNRTDDTQDESMQTELLNNKLKEIRDFVADCRRMQNSKKLKTDDDG